MAENVFEAVKQSVSTRDAAAFYGIEVKRNGMACCPFHDDKNPSMKLNEEYFYCFGCGATGDVIDFTAKLFDLSSKEAAEKLAQDFGLIYDHRRVEMCLLYDGFFSFAVVRQDLIFYFFLVGKDKQDRKSVV